MYFIYLNTLLKPCLSADVIETMDLKQEDVKWSSAMLDGFYQRSHGIPRFFLKHSAFKARCTIRQGGVFPESIASSCEIRSSAFFYYYNFFYSGNVVIASGKSAQLYNILSPGICCSIQYYRMTFYEAVKQV